MELGEAQKNSPEAFESLGDHLKIKNLYFHETIEKSTKIIDFSSPEGQLGVQICFKEVRKLREQQLEGAKTKPREKKNSKKRRRERQGAPEELGSHDSSALTSDYELPRSPRESRKSSQRALEELLGSRNDARRRSKELPRSLRKLRRRSEDQKLGFSRNH